ncbi:MAG: sortase [Ruminococcus sp.]
MTSKHRHSKKSKGLLCIILGLLFIIAALFLASFNLYDQLRAADASSHLLSLLSEDSRNGVSTGGTEDVPGYILHPNMEMPVKNVNGTEIIGILEIPSLKLRLPVISSWSYPALQTAPCRYSGSAYLNNLVICGHNYPSHFGNLANLAEDDVAVFTDIDGNVFTYKMVERETLMPDSVEDMESGDWDLTLFTCTLSGQSRVTVRFELI